MLYCCVIALLLTYCILMYCHCTAMLAHEQVLHLQGERTRIYCLFVSSLQT
jgi:hypothetical protein